MNRLGRGLGDLIPVKSKADLLDSSGVEEVSLRDVYPSTFQPRLKFDDKDIRELSESIKQHGLIQPILVRKTAKGYEIIAGERRFRASLLAQAKNIQVIIRQVDDKDLLQLAMIENLERKNLSVFELAKGYEKLIKDFRLNHEEIGKIFNKKRSSICNQLRLLKLPEFIQDMVIQKKIKEGHARALLALPNDEDRIVFAKTVVLEKLSVRELEKRVALSLNPAKALAKQSDVLIQKVAAKTGLNILLDGDEKSGMLKISFNDLESKSALLTLLKKWI